MDVAAPHKTFMTQRVIAEWLERLVGWVHGGRLGTPSKDCYDYLSTGDEAWSLGWSLIHDRKLVTKNTLLKKEKTFKQCVLLYPILGWKIMIFRLFGKMWSQTKENVCCRANVTWRNYTSCQNVTWRNYTGKVAKRAFQDCDQIFQGDQIKQICNFPCIINLNLLKRSVGLHDFHYKGKF